MFAMCLLLPFDSTHIVGCYCVILLVNMFVSMNKLIQSTFMQIASLLMDMNLLMVAVTLLIEAVNSETIEVSTM